MRYLLDANSFITPYKNYYQMDLFPSYWERFSELSENHFHICDHVKNELLIAERDEEKDDLQVWVENHFNGDCISERSQEVFEVYQQVMEYVASSEYYNDRAFDNWSIPSVADPWIVAVAKVHNLKVVSLEVRDGNLRSGSPKKAVKLPDICDVFEVEYITLQGAFRLVGFSL